MASIRYPTEPAFEGCWRLVRAHSVVSHAGTWWIDMSHFIEYWRTGGYLGYFGQGFLS